MPRPAWRRLTLSLLVTASLGLTLLLLARASQPNRNQPALGAGAAVDTIDIALSPPQELDGKARSAILDLRRQAAARYPGLLAGSYTPSPQVFSMSDGLPWWGIAGQFYYGKGEHSIDGPSEESRFILNPYLLVAAELRGLSIWSDGERALVWDKARISGQDLADPDFPFYCRPTALRWGPRAARATVTYDVSGCLAELNRWTSYPLTVADASLDLIAYNARDMNLNYLYLSLADSDNLSAGNPMQSPIAILQFLHAGDSCGYPGGCNNMSPRVPEFINIRIERLPARATIWLWYNRPAGVDQPPDMTFTIDFQQWCGAGRLKPMADGCPDQVKKKSQPTAGLAFRRTGDGGTIEGIGITVRSNVTQEKKNVPGIAKALRNSVLCLANPSAATFRGIWSSVTQERGFFVQRNPRMRDFSGTADCNPCGAISHHW